MAKASEWACRVKAWRASGKSAKAFCVGREYSAQNLLWWSSHLRRQGIELSTSERTVGLARVVRASCDASGTSPLPITVHVGVVRVEVPSGVDRASLTAVFEALAATAGAAR